MTKINYYVYQLIMPRTTFAQDMTPDEAAIMSRHAEYWRDLMGHGRVVAFGPVLDPAGSWGLALVAGATSQEVSQLGD